VPFDGTSPSSQRLKNFVLTRVLKFSSFGFTDDRRAFLFDHQTWENHLVLRTYNPILT